MSGQNLSPCLVLAVMSSSAFLEAGRIVNLVRAYDALKITFPDQRVHVAARELALDNCRLILGHRIEGPELVAVETLEPTDLAKGLMQYWKHSTSIFIHDASRPFTDQEQIKRVLDAFNEDIDAVRPALPFTETLKILTANSVIEETLDRSSVLRISTPELIRTSAIDANGFDSGWLLPLKANTRVMHVEGNPSGLRINSKADVQFMELQ